MILFSNVLQVVHLSRTMPKEATAILLRHFVQRLNPVMLLGVKYLVDPRVGCRGAVQGKKVRTDGQFV